MFLDKRSELSSSFIVASEEIGTKMKPSKKLVRTCKDYIIGREITTMLKIAVD